MPTKSARSQSKICIGPGKAVRLRFWARHRTSGELLQYGEDLSYLHGAFGGVFQKVQQVLDGSQCGDQRTVQLDPDEAYGHRDPRLVIERSREEIPEEAHSLGSVLFGELADGREHPFSVIQIDADRLILDGNHPWAGLPLEFTFEVLAIREATAEECALGHPLS